MRTLTWLWVATCLAACGSEQNEDWSDSVEEFQRTGAKLTLRVIDMDTLASGPFPIWDTKGLLVSADLENVTGAHELRFELLNPSGTYSVEEVTFDTRAQLPSERKVGGRDLLFVPTIHMQDGERVERVVPVKGTPIWEYVLTGDWSVQASLDGRLLGRAGFSFVDPESDQ